MLVVDALAVASGKLSCGQDTHTHAHTHGA